MQSVYNVQLVTYGSDYAMSAIGIINSIAQLLGMSVVALNQSAQPIYGYNWGAMAFKRVRKCLVLCFVSGISIGIFGEVLVQLFPAAIIRMFDAKDVNLLHVGVQGLRIFFLLFPLASIQIVSAGYFQGVGKAGYAAAADYPPVLRVGRGLVLHPHLRFLRHHTLPVVALRRVSAAE